MHVYLSFVYCERANPGNVVERGKDEIVKSKLYKYIALK